MFIETTMSRFILLFDKWTWHLGTRSVLLYILNLELSLETHVKSLKFRKYLFYISTVLKKNKITVVTFLEYQKNVNSIYFQRTVTQDFISYLFFFIIAVPDFLKFIQSVAQFVFGKRESPKCARFLMVISVYHLGLYIIIIYIYIFI